MSQHYYSSTSVATTLSASINNSQTTFTCPDVAGDNGWPTSFPFTLAIDYGSVGVELVDVTSKGTVTSSVRTWNCTRAIDFTTGSAHSSGAKVQHVIAARDFTEARQARSLQPVDTENTYIVREATAGAEFFDSAVGDLIIKAKSGAVIRIGLDSNTQEYLSIDATNSIFANQTLVAGAASGSFRKGSGSAQGTNYTQVIRASVVQAMTVNTWTTVSFNSVTSTVADDGSGYTTPTFTTRVSGYHVGIATCSFSALGAKSLRWITQGGSVVALSEDNGGGTFSCPIAVITPGGGYTMTVQANSTVTANLTINSSTAPSLAYLGTVA